MIHPFINFRNFSIWDCFEDFFFRKLFQKVRKNMEKFLKECLKNFLTNFSGTFWRNPGKNVEIPILEILEIFLERFPNKNPNSNFWKDLWRNTIMRHKFVSTPRRIHRETSAGTQKTIYTGKTCNKNVRNVANWRIERWNILEEFLKKSFLEGFLKNTYNGTLESSDKGSERILDESE